MRALIQIVALHAGQHAEQRHRAEGEQERDSEEEDRGRDQPGNGRWSLSFDLH